MSDRSARSSYSRSRAVVMGTWKYSDHDLTPLPAAKNSWQRFQTMLIERCGWPKDKITPVSNEPHPGKIGDRLITEFKAARDVALFYYVGHGMTDPRDELCLALTGTANAPERRAATSLRYSDVRSALLESRANTKIVILDCCCSGYAILPSNSLAGPSTATLENTPIIVADRAATDGTYVVVAAGASMSAFYENDPFVSWPQTYFTKHFVDLVEGGIESGPRSLTLETLFAALASSLSADGRPRPQRRGINRGGDFEFCSNAAPAVTIAEPAYWDPLRSSREASPAEWAAKPIREPTGRYPRGAVLGVSGLVIAAAAGMTLIQMHPGDNPATPLPHASARAPHGQVTLKSLSIHPHSVATTTGDSLRLTLSGVLSDSKQAPAAALAGAGWQSADRAVATVTTAGVITAVKPGTTLVTARIGSRTASIHVTVSAAARVKTRRQATPTPTLYYNYQASPGPSTVPTPTPTPSPVARSTSPKPTPTPTPTQPVVTITPSTL